jgi:type IV secretion system protein VirB10
MNVQSPARRDHGGAPESGDPRPLVAAPNPGLPGLAIAGIAALLAILLFFMLDGQRRRAATEGTHSDQGQATIFAPPPLVIPPQPVQEPAPLITIPVQPQPRAAPMAPHMQAPAPVIVPVSPDAAPSPAMQPTAPPSPKLTEPALIYDAGAGPEAGKPIAAPSSTPQAGAVNPGTARAQPAARPTRIANPSTVVPTGTLIKAVLETPIDTSKPGMARAIVSGDARGFDGQRVLIPRGSRLIGEYDADVRAGQKRVLVNWIQLVRPDGTTIRLDSPAADAMGGAGVPGRVHTFFFQRFANAVLQTALTLGGSLAAWSSDAPVIVGLGTGPVSTVAGQGGIMGQSPQPKITVRQGTMFNVFVARDLDFSGAPAIR